MADPLFPSKPDFSTDTVKAWHETSYREGSFASQRYYPAEELLRFFGRNFFSLDIEARGRIKVLDAGCGSGSNLWMIAKEGFRAHGLDLSEAGIELCHQMLRRWNVQASLEVGSITDMPYPTDAFDVICDVLVSHCLDNKGLEEFLEETRRTLKPGGKFFMLTPSVNSKAFTHHAPAKLLDASTLNGIYRKDSPYYGSFHPFRFSDPQRLLKILETHGFRTDCMELITRTYNRMTEPFQFISVEASKL